TGFGFGISVLVKRTHITGFEAGGAGRRKVSVDVGQVESEAVAASKVRGPIEDRADLRLRDGSRSPCGDVYRAVRHQLKISLHLVDDQDVNVHTQTSGGRAVSQQEGFRQRQDRRRHASVHV